MRVAFRKMHGLGNDFVVLDARDTPFEPSRATRRALADRHRGVGCDQLIILDRSERADVAIRIFNPDGGEAEACGNATRCVASLFDRPVAIESAGAILHARSAGSDVAVDMGEPRFGWEQIPLAFSMDTSALPLAWSSLSKPVAVNVGNPHVVFFVPDVDAVPLGRLGPEIEGDPAFPDRVNVGVAAVSDEGLALRVWERGAGLTLACGTGACAAAVAAIRGGRATSPVRVTLPGGTLEIAWQAGGTITMTGAATHVFDGTIDLEALG